uniref:Transposase and inactivated derivatives-like protein n=3 Tax=Shewanella TaxID=22 RepID=A4YB87_SHEPC
MIQEWNPSFIKNELVKTSSKKQKINRTIEDKDIVFPKELAPQKKQASSKKQAQQSGAKPAGENVIDFEHEKKSREKGLKNDHGIKNKFSASDIIDGHEDLDQQTKDKIEESTPTAHEYFNANPTATTNTITQINKELLSNRTKQGELIEPEVLNEHKDTMKCDRASSLPSMKQSETTLPAEDHKVIGNSEQSNTIKNSPEHDSVAHPHNITDTATVKEQIPISNDMPEGEEPHSSVIKDQPRANRSVPIVKSVNKAGIVNAIYSKLPLEIKNRRKRELNSRYPVIWIIQNHHETKEKDLIVSTVCALNKAGNIELLDLYLSDNIVNNHSLAHILNDFKKRGVKEILTICSDTSHKDSMAALKTQYPHTELQLCILGKIRSSTESVLLEDQKNFNDDLQKIQMAQSITEAELVLSEVRVIWGDKYPDVVDSWYKEWEYFTKYFTYPVAIRETIYTMNAVELMKKLLKNTSEFNKNESAQSLITRLYENIFTEIESWGAPFVTLDYFMPHLHDHFEERLKGSTQLKRPN